MNATAHRRGAWDRLPLPIRQIIREMCRERGGVNIFDEDRLHRLEQQKLRGWFAYANGEGPRYSRRYNCESWYFEIVKLRSYPYWDGNRETHLLHLTPGFEKMLYTDRFDRSHYCLCCRHRVADRAFCEAIAVNVFGRGWTLEVWPRKIQSATARSRLLLSLSKSGRQLSNGSLYPPTPP